MALPSEISNSYKEEDAFSQVLEAEIFKVLEYGKWLLVAYGWDKVPHGGVNFGIMTCTIDEFPHVVNFLTRKKGSKTNLGSSIPVNAMMDIQEIYSGVHVHTFPLHGFDGDYNDKTKMAKVRETCAKFAACHWEERAVALVDICGFTKLSPVRQLASIMSLNKALNSAYRRLYSISRARKDANLPTLALCFRRSTTGDGYYIWNDTFGQYGDLAVLALLLQTISVVEERRSEVREHPIRVKSAFTIGEIFCMADRGITWESVESQYAVGPATNYLARLLSKAWPGQILMGNLLRTESGNRKPLEPEEFLREALAILQEQLPEGLETETCVVSYDKNKALRVEDKHGDFHYCYNLVCRVANSLDKGTRNIAVRVGVPKEETSDICDLRFRQDVECINLTSRDPST